MARFAVLDVIHTCPIGQNAIRMRGKYPQAHPGVIILRKYARESLFNRRRTSPLNFFGEVVYHLIGAPRTPRIGLDERKPYFVGGICRRSVVTGSSDPCHGNLIVGGGVITIRPLVRMLGDCRKRWLISSAFTPHALIAAIEHINLTLH